MVRRTDDSENAEFHGILTILGSPESSGGGDGSLEVSGKVYTDYIQGNLENGPVDINGVSIGNGNITIASTTQSGVVPSVGDHLFYVKDNLLQSLNSSGTVTVYQPNTTKGDLISHNGSTQIRVPIGASGNVLTVDPTTESGLKWTTPQTGSSRSSNRFTLLVQGSEGSVSIMDNIYSSTFAAISPYISGAAGGTFIFSKSIDNRVGNFIKINSSPVAGSGGRLECIYNSYSSPEIYKDYSTGDGDYSLVTSDNYYSTNLTLTGTSWVSLGTEYSGLSGVYFISIYSDLNGSCASFLICKSFSSSLGPALTKLSSSPSITGGNLELRWNASSGIEIRKTSSGEDGGYLVVDNFQNSISSTISLNSTNLTTITDRAFRYYERKNMILRISSKTLSDAPCSIYFISKNERQTRGNRYSLFSPGKTTLEKIEINWNINSLLTLNKTGENYNGEYIVEIIN